MAVRPVFIVNERKPFYSVWNCEFTYNSGFSVQQKQRNIIAIHSNFENRFKHNRVLEISSKSMQDLGVKLSAFNLTKYVPELGRSVPVECVYQAGKVFAGNVQYNELLEATPKNAKRDERLSSSGRIVSFSFDGKEYPAEPKNAFYDFIYINALLEHEELLEELLEYDAFTDIEFNPEKSINCQARAAAVLVSLARSGAIDKAKDFYELASLFGKTDKTDIEIKLSLINENKDVEPKSTKADESPVFSIGQTIKHPAFGEGKIIKVTENTVTIKFGVGEKILSTAWVNDKCKIM